MTHARNEGVGWASHLKHRVGPSVGWLVLIIIAALLSFCAGPKPVYAETRLGLHVGSYHFSGDFNNFNPGVYVYHDGWTAGTYYNSERKQSAYAGYTFTGQVSGPLSYGLSVGLVSGYARGKVLPMVLPSLSLPVSDTGWQLRLSLVPPAGKNSAAATHLSIERSF